VPQLAPEAIIAIISAVVGGAGLGESIYQMQNQPKPPTAAQLQAQLQQSQQLTPAQLATAVNQAKGNVQTSTGGGVSPDYLAQLIQSQYGGSAGNPGNIQQQAQSIWGGGTSFGTSGSAGSGGSGSPTTGGIPFGNASTGGLTSFGLASPTSSNGFSLSDWLQQFQQQGATA
jgi:hypothetical protein